MNEKWLLFFAAVPVLGVSAQWLAWRLRLPSILLLLLMGVLLRYLMGALFKDETASSGEIIPDHLLFPVVSLAVAVILFEGGLSLRFRELENGGTIVFRLVTVGAVASWLLTTLAAVLILGFKPPLAALAGAVFVVTGPTVVAPLLRLIRPRGRIGSIVKWEGIVIDPIGAVLAVLVFETAFAHHDAPMGVALLIPLKTLAIGVVLGAATAEGLIQIVRRYWIPDYLHGVVFLAATLGCFAVSNLLHEESGLVTVTVLGVLLANQKRISIRHVVEFKEHLGVFLIACLFVVLGSRIDPSSLFQLGWKGVAFLAAMVLLVRPLSVGLASIKSGLSVQEGAFLAMLAPRGIVAAAVSSIFALRLESLARENPAITETAGPIDQLVPLTFLTIVGTVAIYGLSAAPLARKLGLAESKPSGILFACADAWIRELAGALQKLGCQVMLVDTNYANIAAAKMAHLPAECASILSEHVREELDLGGLGLMLAVTPNDEVNALAVGEFGHFFGRANVYQLASPKSSGPRRQTVPHQLQGRLLFGEQFTHEHFERLHSLGAQIRNTKLTAEYTWEEFQQMYQDTAAVLFIVDPEKRIQPVTADTDLKPQAGETLVAIHHAQLASGE